MKLNLRPPHAVLASVALGLALGFAPDRAAGDPAAPVKNEADLIRLLQSDAPKADKAITCKHLAIYGSTTAVPALAPLLLDEELSSWARIALEAIPDPAADDALRAALAKVDGRRLVAVINSIGVRRDAKAVPDLTRQLKHPDAEVASAAAAALGRIGGDAAARALQQALGDAPGVVRSPVAQGCIRCAEGYLANGDRRQAMALYDAVRAAKLPKQRILEATRGAIVARQSAGIPLLLEQLRASDPALVGIGLRTARELPGRDVSEALAKELAGANVERQGPLLLALADRRDASVLPAVLKLADTGPTDLRIVAIGALDRIGNASCIPVLLKAATDTNAPLARAGKLAVARLEGNAVDADLLARLPASSGKMRQVLIELAGQRRLEKALPLVLKSAEDTDPGVRRAACETLGILGGERESAELVRLLQTTQDARQLGEIEKALASICGRKGAPTLPQLLPLIRSQSSAVRIAGLHLLATVGGAEALAAVRTCLSDRDAEVQDEAVRTLAGWPGNWPEDTAVGEPLLALAKGGGKPAHQIQGLRGYLQYLRENRSLSDAQKLARVQEVLPLVQRPEEKLLAVAVLGTIPTAAALEMLTGYTSDDALAEEACQAILKIVANERMTDQTARRGALQTVAGKAKNGSTRRRAEVLLKTP
jgi:HEAT repeat protein